MAEEEFSFVKEKIKRRPIYQNKTFRRVLFGMLMSAVCGVIACFVFVQVHPWMEEHFGQQETTEISFPREEEPQEEEEEEVPETVPQEPIVITETQELEVTDYKKLYKKLGDVAAEGEKSLVTVTAASSDTDWFNETYENQVQLSGLLVGNNGVELLILTEYSQIQSADQLQVTFVDGSSHDAVLKNYDTVTQLAVISVNLADVEDATMEEIQMANLGSSGNLSAGEPVIAVGSPAGVADSVMYGNLVSAGYAVSVIDGEYQVLITDMNGGTSGSGVLLNLSGQVIGLIENRYLQSSNTAALTAYGISDMKDMIEHLSNSQDLVYIGITGTTVTEEIAQSGGLPVGVYITGVEMNSPAMNAGIQQGDILTEINGQEITDISGIRELLLKFSKDQVIQVKVMRQGREEYKEISCSVTVTAM